MHCGGCSGYRRMCYENEGVRHGPSALGTGH